MADETPTSPSAAERRRSETALRADLKRAELELALTEAQYTRNLLAQLMRSEQRLQEANLALPEPDDANWDTLGGPGAANKSLTDSRDLATVRRQMYRFWRYQPHARGVIRNFVRFIVGPGFGLDLDDVQRGYWNDDKKRTEVVITEDPEDDLAVDLVWKDFAKRNKFTQRAKELVQRTFRDGECFIRKFTRKGKVDIRFVEPERVTGPSGSGVVQKGDLDEDLYVGEPTTIRDGIEHLSADVETVVAYHIKAGPGGQETPERVPASEMLHAKALADFNDLRGIPVLEVVAKRLTNYDQWEEYRMILNKVRTAVALVRKVTGTSSQAEAIIRNRLSPRSEPRAMEPQTGSGRRETMFRPGTTLTPSPGVEYQFISPNLEARDASEDGRRFLLSIAAGVGMPEMMVTGDWSNSNFASSVEARTPAVREWQDWQEFFTPIFEQIFAWVIDAAVEAEVLPEETSREVTFQWPPLVEKDAAKETERLDKLNTKGILSKQTWSAMEGLDFQAEQENRQQEEDLMLPAAPGDMAPDGGDGEDGETPPKKKAKESDTPVEPDDTPKTAAEALLDLAALQEELDTLDDPLMRQAVTRYVETTNRVLLHHRRRPHAASPTHAPARSRARR